MYIGWFCQPGEAGLPGGKLFHFCNTSIHTYHTAKRIRTPTTLIHLSLATFVEKKRKQVSKEEWGDDTHLNPKTPKTGHLG